MSETPKTDAAYKACRSAGALGIIDPLTQCSALLERQLEEANERAGNLNVELAAMTQERDELRREVEEQRKVIRLMSVRCAMYCSWAYKCPKQPVDGRFDKETCYQCQTGKYKQQAAMAGKEVTK